MKKESERRSESRTRALSEVLSRDDAVGRHLAITPTLSPTGTMQFDLGGTANMAVLGGNLPPKQFIFICSLFGAPLRAAFGGLVARQNAPVARSTLNSTAWFRPRRGRRSPTLGRVHCSVTVESLTSGLPSRSGEGRDEGIEISDCMDTAEIHLILR